MFSAYQLYYRLVYPKATIPIKTHYRCTITLSQFNTTSFKIIITRIGTNNPISLMGNTTAYMVAATQGQLNMIKWLLLRYEPPQNINILCLASGRGHLETAKWLFKHGFTMDMDTANSVLHNVSRDGNYHMVRWLMRTYKNLDIHRKYHTYPSSNMSSVEAAIYYHRQKIIRFFQKIDPTIIYNPYFWIRGLNGNTRLNTIEIEFGDAYE